MNEREHMEQTALVAWADRTRIDGVRLGEYLAAIPNGGARHKATGAKLKAEGVRAGFPDLGLFIPIGPWCGLFIEMKAPGAARGAVRENQKQWLERLAAAGYAVAVCYGWDHAATVIRAYCANAHVNPEGMRQLDNQAPPPEFDEPDPNAPLNVPILGQ